jgi:hypothetical protein
MLTHAECFICAGGGEPGAREKIKVLVIHWKEDPGVQWAYSLTCAEFLDNTKEVKFWKQLDADPEIQVVVKPPFELRAGESQPIQLPKVEKLPKFLEEEKPDIVVLDVWSWMTSFWT